MHIYIYMRMCICICDSMIIHQHTQNLQGLINIGIPKSGRWIRENCERQDSQLCNAGLDMCHPMAT